MNVGTVHANTMAVAAATDAQLRPPTHPRLVRGLVMVPLSDGLLLEGGPERVVLRGAGARALPQLLGLLDGTRDAAAVAAAVDLPEQSVTAALALLRARGVLEAAHQGGPVAVPSDVLSALSRRVDRTRVHENAEQAALALVQSRVVLLECVRSGTDAPVDAALVEGLLRAAGPVQISRQGPVGDADLVVGIGDGCLDPSASTGARAGGPPYLPVSQRGSTLVIGPLIRSDLPCAQCAQAAIDSALEDAAPGRPGIGVSEALVATQVFGLLARTAPVRTVRRLVRLDLHAWHEESRSAPELPACRYYAGGAVPPDPRPLLLEEQLAFPPQDLVDPRDHQGHYAPANVALQRSRRHLPAGPAQPLGVPTSLRPGLPLGVALRQIALRTVGILGDDGRQVQRWAPSGGNIGSAQVDLVVPDHVPGLDPGVWSVDTLDNQLVRRSDGAPAVEGVPQGCAALVLTAGLGRVGTKYGAAAYRIVHLDAGVAQVQAMFVARALGLTARPLLGWSQGVAAAVGTDPRSEPVTGVVLIEPPVDPAADGPSGGTRYLPSQPRALHGDLVDSPVAVVSDLLEDLQVRPADLAGPGHGTHHLQDAAVGGDLDALLRRRRSVRRWSPHRTGREAIEAALRAARDGEAALRRSHDDRPGLGLVLLAADVTGLPAGVYDVGADADLARRGPLDARGLRAAVLQPEYADSPAVVLALAPLSLALAVEGAHAYRRLLVTAGAALQAGWLTGVQRGLVGGIFAGVLPDYATRIAGGHPADRRPILALALGGPRSSP